MDKEIWKPIPNTIGYYASSHGRIKSPRCILKQCSNGKAGYQQVSVIMDGIRITKTVHSLIALTFHGPRPDGLDIAHRDNDKTNNRPDNLRYCTRSDNLKDSAADRVGRLLSKPTRSEPRLSNRTLKLTPNQRREIIERVMAGQETQAQIGAEYGIVQTAVSNLYRRAMVLN